MNLNGLGEVLLIDGQVSDTLNTSTIEDHCMRREGHEASHPL